MFQMYVCMDDLVIMRNNMLEKHIDIVDDIFKQYRDASQCQYV